MPIKKSFGFEATLVKSFTVKDAPNPNMISAKATGAIVVTIPMTPLCNFIRDNLKDF